MTNETVHPGGGYQPPKSDKPKAQNPPGSGAHETPLPPSSGNPSDLELKIRKEVMDAVDELVAETNNEYSTSKVQTLTEIIQDRLNLLWGECDD